LFYEKFLDVLNRAGLTVVGLHTRCTARALALLAS
jgi:hypothetical protein